MDNGEKGADLVSDAPASQDTAFRRRLWAGIWMGLKRAILALLLLLLGYLLLWPRFLESTVPAGLSRVKTDMRSIGTAIESYYTDHGVYPPGYAYWGTPPAMLTTPIAYITGFAINPYAQKRIARVKITREVLLSAAPVYPGLLGLVLLASAWGIFRYGRTPKRYPFILALGFLGLSWGVFSIVSAWLVSRGTLLTTDTMRTRIHPFAGAAFALAAIALLAFASGLRKAMKNTDFWGPPLGTELFSIVLWFGLFLGVFVFSSGYARLRVENISWPIPTDRTFLYATDGREKWLLWSGGPDGTRDLPEEALPGILKTKTGPEIEALLLRLAYDPTNGTLSRGDICLYDR